MTELESQFDNENAAFGATEEEMEVKMAEILSQLELASKCTVDASGDPTDDETQSKYLDVTKIMDLNRECRKRIAQIGEIKGQSCYLPVKQF